MHTFYILTLHVYVCVRIVHTKVVCILMYIHGMHIFICININILCIHTFYMSFTECSYTTHKIDIEGMQTWCKFIMHMYMNVCLYVKYECHVHVWCMMYVHMMYVCCTSLHSCIFIIICYMKCSGPGVFLKILNIYKLHTILIINTWTCMYVCIWMYKYVCMYKYECMSCNVP